MTSRPTSWNPGAYWLIGSPTSHCNTWESTWTLWTSAITFRNWSLSRPLSPQTREHHQASAARLRSLIAVIVFLLLEVLTSIVFIIISILCHHTILSLGMLSLPTSLKQNGCNIKWYHKITSLLKSDNKAGPRNQGKPLLIVTFNLCSIVHSPFYIGESSDWS